MSNEEKDCSHNPRYREYYRDGIFKCYDCRRIIIEQECETTKTIQPMSNEETIQTNLTGDVRFSDNSIRTSKNCEDLLIEIEAVMTKYKVVKIDLCFDVFKLKKTTNE